MDTAVLIKEKKKKNIVGICMYIQCIKQGRQVLVSIATSLKHSRGAFGFSRKHPERHAAVARAWRKQACAIRTGKKNTLKTPVKV